MKDRIIAIVKEVAETVFAAVVLGSIFLLILFCRQ